MDHQATAAAHIARQVYLVVDTRTGLTVQRFTTLPAAYRNADRRDSAHGSVRFAVRFDRS